VALPIVGTVSLEPRHRRIISVRRLVCCHEEILDAAADGVKQMHEMQAF
jgi:hypothetical protein